MSNREFQEASREAAQRIVMDSQVRMAEYLHSDKADPEVVIKIHNASKDVAGAVPDRKADPYGSLPVVNITVVNNGYLAQVKAAPFAIDAVVLEAQPGRLLEHDVIDVEPVRASPPSPPVRREIEITPVHEIAEAFGVREIDFDQLLRDFEE